MSSKAKSLLQLKIQNKIQHLFLDFFEKSDFKFKNDKFFISVVEADISPDMKNLRIILDIQNLPENEKNKVIQKLNFNNISIIKNLLAKNINLKFVPNYKFILDTRNEKLFKINQIIKNEYNKSLTL